MPGMGSTWLHWATADPNSQSKNFVSAAPLFLKGLAAFLGVYKFNPFVHDSSSSCTRSSNCEWLPTADFEQATPACH